MRTFILAATIALSVAAAAPARAEVGVGAFVGEPTGLDVKLGLTRRTALDLLFGWYSHWDDFNDGAYAHVTYLVQPLVAQGRSVLVPLRLGIGLAVFDDQGRFNDHLHAAIRFPLEVALKFRNAPLEIYGEVAVKVTAVDPDPQDHPLVDLDGGIGIRFYF